jgi:hypothetical protein
MVLDSASRHLAIEAEGEGRDDLPFFFYDGPNELSEHFRPNDRMKRSLA